MALAGGIYLLHLLFGELGGGDVGSALAHPDEGAIISDVRVSKEGLCGAVQFFKKPPEAAAAYL